MNKQDNNSSGGEKSDVTAGLRLASSLRPVVAAILLGAIVFSTNTFAHNIDLDKAWEITRAYARLVRTESKGYYLHYGTNCESAYPGHNHIVRCVVQYQNANDAKTRVWTCTERVEIYYEAHRKGSMNYIFYYRHTSGNKCGNRVIDYIDRSALGI